MHVLPDLIELRVYTRPGGECPFGFWLSRLRDVQVQARIDARLARVRAGNYGDAKSIGEGVYELRLSFGPGYRVYYGQDGPRLVILLAGGTKQRQNADIARAKMLWREYLAEKNHAHD